MSHRPTDAAAEPDVLSLCRQGPNAVERAAISRRSSRHASAGPSSPNGRLTVAVAQNRPAPKRTAPRHPARVAQIVARLSRRTDQILLLCATYTVQRRRPATPLERHPAHSAVINWDLEVYVLAIVYALGSIAVATRIAAPRMQTHCDMLPSGYPESNGRLDRGFISLVERLLRGRAG
jgi:hypothetical protein